jgi:hypothetical protein
MYTLVRRVGVRELLARQLPSIVASLVLAESFFKFHSFTLECLAFLGTWAGLDFVLSKVVPRLRPRAVGRAA